MAYDLYKNSLIDTGPYAGETELGVDFFQGDELLPLDTLISKEFVCARCGRPVDILICKQTNGYICEKCRDQAPPGRTK